MLWIESLPPHWNIFPVFFLYMITHMSLFQRPRERKTDTIFLWGKLSQISPGCAPRVLESQHAPSHLVHMVYGSSGGELLEKFLKTLFFASEMSHPTSNSIHFSKLNGPLRISTWKSQF